MILQRRHPDVAYRDCGECLEFVFDEAGQIVTGMDNRPVRRAKKAPAPCRTHVGCPKGTPESPRSLWPCNQQFLRAYRIAKLTGRWPEDSLFLEVSARLSQAEESLDRADHERMLARLVELGTSKAVASM